VSEGGTPFEKIDAASQVAISELMASVTTVYDLCLDDCPLILVKVNLMSLRGIIDAVLTCDAPNNTIMPKPDHRLSEEAAETIVSAIEIPDNVSDLLGGEDE
jgi:hypothetical protein